MKQPSQTGQPRGRGETLAQRLLDVCTALIPVLGVLWLVDVPIRLGLGIITDQYVLVIAGLSVAAAFLMKPYGARAGALEITLALIGLGCWAWSALNYADWLLNAADRPPMKWVPGLIALLLLLEAVRRTCGLAIAGLMGVIGLYGFVGHWLPGWAEAAYTEPRRMIMYLYADSNGVSGLVLATAATVVLAFILFSKTLEVGGAGRFFDNVSVALLGRFRGGPAKVAVFSSSLFGLISGSSVANVVSSGIVTIPLMKRHGVRPAYAGAVEAVSSNAGQITPPVMGATAFLIAEFLQIPYSEVVLAAALPALVFYVVLLFQIDAHAARNGLAGLPRQELPRLGRVLADGWIFVLPIALLVWLMFSFGLDAAKAALISGAAMLGLGFVKGRRLPDLDMLRRLTVGCGTDLVQILLVSAAAGIVVGVLNITGLSFTLTLVLSQVAENAGTVALLAVTALIALVLGMGMPTAAVYVLLSVVLAPTLVRLGLEPLSAHLFIFYFGLLSMLTPPVAMASFAAASIAESDLWRTSLIGLKLGAAGYLLPFLFALNPALLMLGSGLEIALAVATAGSSGVLLAWAAEGSIGARRAGIRARICLAAAALAVGSSTIWLGPASLWCLAVLVLGFVPPVVTAGLASRRFRRAERPEQSIRNDELPGPGRPQAASHKTAN